MTLKGWIKTTKRYNASSTYDLEGLRKKVGLMAELLPSGDPAPSRNQSGCYAEASA